MSRNLLVICFAFAFAIPCAEAQDPRVMLSDLKRMVRSEVVSNNLPLAETLAHRALDLAHKNARHPVDVMDWQHELAQIQKAQGKVPEAGSMYLAELTARESMFGANHSLNMHSIHDVASNLEEQCNLADALVMLKREQAILESIYGPNHLALAGIHMDLGRVLFKSNRLPESLTHYDKATALLDANDAVKNCLMLRQAHAERARSASCIAAAH